MSQINSTSVVWKKCSSCKKDIYTNAKYFECSVSTCTGLRTGYVFCSVPCWERHLPGARHRDAGAIEKKSPAHADLAKPVSAEVREVLVVVSKMKQYVRDQSGFNTSDEVCEKLSEMIRHACDEAIQKAKNDGRKTVMARDF